MKLSSIFRNKNKLCEFVNKSSNPYVVALQKLQMTIDNTPPASPYVADAHYKAIKDVRLAIADLMMKADKAI